jgi:outer membrane biogenesis lipoprotein LolB
MTRTALAAILATLWLAGCSTASPDHVKTSDEWLAEQEAEGAKIQQEKQKTDGAYAEPDTTEDEKRKEWDDKQADLELKRAARSAETCPESVTEKAPKGKATVTLTFTNDGRVKDSKISDQYAENAVGKCVLRAMGSVIVPAYTGGEKTVEWEIDLTGGKKSGAAEKKEKE